MARRIKRAVVKYHRAWRSTEAPYGYDDLPDSVGAFLVLEAGRYGDHQITEGIHGGSAYTVLRCLTWDYSHPRHRSIIDALRSTLQPHEVGLRVAVYEPRRLEEVQIAMSALEKFIDEEVPVCEGQLRLAVA